jgi:hypothetical protein
MYGLFFLLLIIMIWRLVSDLIAIFLIFLFAAMISKMLKKIVGSIMKTTDEDRFYFLVTLIILAILFFGKNYY